MKKSGNSRPRFPDGNNQHQLRKLGPSKWETYHPLSHKPHHALTAPAQKPRISITCHHSSSDSSYYFTLWSASSCFLALTYKWVWYWRLSSRCAKHNYTSKPFMIGWGGTTCWWSLGSMPSTEENTYFLGSIYQSPLLAQVSSLCPLNHGKHPILFSSVPANLEWGCTPAIPTLMTPNQSCKPFWAPSWIQGQPRLPRKSLWQEKEEK